MNIVDIPDDLRRAPYAMQREFIVSFNEASVHSKEDPLKTARAHLISVFGLKGEAEFQGKIFLQSEMKGCFGQEDI
jgi:hypothetical protein